MYDVRIQKCTLSCKVLFWVIYSKICVYAAIRTDFPSSVPGLHWLTSFLHFKNQYFLFHESWLNVQLIYILRQLNEISRRSRIYNTSTMQFSPLSKSLSVHPQKWLFPPVTVQETSRQPKNWQAISVELKSIQFSMFPFFGRALKIGISHISMGLCCWQILINE